MAGEKIWRLELDLSQEEFEMVKNYLDWSNIGYDKSLYDLNPISDMEDGNGNEQTQG